MSYLLNRLNPKGETVFGCGTAEVASVAAAGRRAAVLPGTWRYCRYGTGGQRVIVFVRGVYSGRGGAFEELGVGKVRVIKPNAWVGRGAGRMMMRPDAGADSRAGWTKVLYLMAADVVADVMPSAEQIAAIVGEIGEPPVGADGGGQ